MLQYASGTKVYTDFAADDVATLIANLSTHLQSAGWTVASGSGTNITLQSVATPTIGNQIRVNIYDGGSGKVRIKLHNKTSTLISSTYMTLVPAASKLYTVVANRHQFCVFLRTSISIGNFVFVSALYIPPHLQPSLSTVAFISGDALNDSDTTLRASFRTGLSTCNNINAGWVGNNAWILNDQMIEYFSSWSGGINGTPMLVSAQAAYKDNTNGFRYFDNTAMIIEPLISMGYPAPTSEGKICGQLWDAAIITQALAIDSIPTPFDGHNWINITNDNPGDGAVMRGSLLLATS